MKLGIVGLGVMGTAVAGHLLEAGHTVRGFDIDTDRIEALAYAGGVPELPPPWWPNTRRSSCCGFPVWKPSKEPPPTSFTARTTDWW